MYSMYTTHFHIKQWHFFPLNVTEISQNSMRIVIKTFTIYKFTHNSETINKLTFFFCTFDTYSRHRKVPSTVQYLLKTRTLHLKLQGTLHGMT